jgi:ribosomal-protein-alanine N-acetyltransferase
MVVRQETGTRYVATESGHLVGTMEVSCATAEEAEIVDLSVEPDRRRQGVGSALLRAFLAGRQGRVFLEVRPSNQAARRLYARFGFRETGRRRAYYQSPPEDAILMEWTSTGIASGRSERRSRSE